MAAAASFQHPTAAGRNDAFEPASTISSYRLPGIKTATHNKLSLSTSSKSLGGYATRPSPTTASYKQSSLRHIDTDMTSYTTTSIIQPGRQDVRHGKLHKRNSSGNSVPNSASPLSASYSPFPTPFATYEEPFPDISTTPTTSTPKIKPYLRKLSSAKDERDQGRLDLSKSTSENGALSGLGINEYGDRSASDVNFSSSGRRTPHMRTTSVGSQVSTASGSYKPSQPFVHPMRQAPSASYTHSYASSMNDEEARESSDVVIEDDLVPGSGFRTRRSISISSTPQPQPTPLSQSHIAADFGFTPGKLTSTSSNISLKSTKSSKTRLPGRSRANTDRSDATPGRTSFDRTFSFASRRSNTEPPLSEKEQVAALRRKFEEKEMRKLQEDREKEEKRNERRRRKEEAAKEEARSEARKGKSGRGGKEKERSGRGAKAKNHESTRPGHITALPERGYEEKKPRVEQMASTDGRGKEGGWAKFVRAMSCG